MSLEPLITAGPVIYAHAALAITAFVLGVVQLLAPKGTVPHRLLGWVWVLIMGGVAASSLLIHELRLWGEWSPIHLLSVFTLFSLVLGVYFARTRNVQDHRRTMVSLFVGALVVAGLFTLVPGRIMNSVLFGPVTERPGAVSN